MQIYETEEEQIAAIKSWWKKNGTSTVTGIIGGILIVGGWNFWQSYQTDKASQASNLYQELLQKQKDENQEAVEKLSQKLTEQFSSTSYADYAVLFSAKNKVHQGNLDEAKIALEKLMNNAGSDEAKNIARLRLARLMLASGDFEKGLQIIAEADASRNEGFEASYNELKGDLYVALDRLGEARTAYESAMREGSTSAILQFKMDDITAPELVIKPIE